MPRAPLHASGVPPALVSEYPRMVGRVRDRLPVLSTPMRQEAVRVGTGWIAQRLAFVILVTLAVISVYAVTTHWYFEDAGAYWHAALRVREGQGLYVANVIDPELYRYAPWFAWVWVPLTFLPESVVMWAWGVIVVGSAVWLIWPQWNPYSVALSLLVLPDLARVTSTGNVQPVMLALIAATLTTRWGPVVVGMMASLKGWPLLFAGWYVGKWERVALAVAVAAILVAPALLYDLSEYPRAAFPAPGTLAAFLVLAKVLSRSGRTA